MIIMQESALLLKRWLQNCSLRPVAYGMVFKMVLAFINHRGRMSCTQAAGAVASLPVHRGQVSRFLAGKQWQKRKFNTQLRELLLWKEAARGEFIFIIDATLVSQSGLKTENTFSTGNRQRRPKKGRRYGKKKIVRKRCHSFTFGLLITPSGIRLPFQIPHYTKEHCAQYDLIHRTTAQAAAELIRTLPLPPSAKVIVLGDTAYDAKVVRKACDDRGYTWIFPANPERVYEGPKGDRPKLRSRLQDWTNLSRTTIRLQASKGKYAAYRRLSPWRVGPKQKPRTYQVYQERQDVRSVGRVKLVFSTMKTNLVKATPDDVKILMTNALDRSVSEIIELYAVRWQIELFFKELKSTFGFSQYRFQRFTAVEGWVETAITAVLFLEYLRVVRMSDRRLSKATRQWWRNQRLHGLSEGYRQMMEQEELKLLSVRLETPGGRAKLQRILDAARPAEQRAAA